MCVQHYLSPFVSCWLLQQNTQRVRLWSDIFIQQIGTGDSQLHLWNTLCHLEGDRETQLEQDSVLGIRVITKRQHEKRLNSWVVFSLHLSVTVNGVCGPVAHCDKSEQEAHCGTEQDSASFTFPKNNCQGENKCLIGNHCKDHWWTEWWEESLRDKRLTVGCFTTGTKGTQSWHACKCHTSALDNKKRWICFCLNLCIVF